MICEHDNAHVKDSRPAKTYRRRRWRWAKSFRNPKSRADVRCDHLANGYGAADIAQRAELKVFGKLMNVDL